MKSHDQEQAPWSGLGYDPDQEGRAFDRRIEERLAAGFVPDIRRAVSCHYFYKSFWREPHYVHTYLGHIASTYVEVLDRHAQPGATVLDVGCGPGYFSLELARAGYHVTGIDVSPSCIRAAEATAADEPHGDGFGSLTYRAARFAEVEGRYEVILFSGALHHFPSVEKVVERAVALLKPGGFLLCYEPIHEAWEVADAAQVALIRGLLSITGHWYESPESLGYGSRPDELGQEALGRVLSDSIEAVRKEYVTERDPSEPDGQSPHDLESTGAEILTALRARFDELEYRPMVSYLHRMLGGLRGPDPVTRRLADFLTAYDRLGLADGFLRPNCFFFAGRLPLDQV